VILLSGGKDDLRKKAFDLFRQGMKLKDIAEQIGVPAGTVRRWKCQEGWDANTESEREQRTPKANARKRRKEALHREIQKVQENTELSEKQRLFCLYYVRYFNATKAYQKAYGCAYSTAASAGWRLLQNPDVKKEIESLKQNRMNRELLSESDIFQKYMDIAFSDITDFLTFGQKEVPVMGAFGPIMIEDPDTGEKIPVTKVVNVISFRESEEVDGTLISEVKQGKDGASIKLADHMKALEWLAEHMNIATDEQKARVEKLKAEAERVQRDNSPDDDDEGVVIINDAPKDC